MLRIKKRVRDAVNSVFQTESGLWFPDWDTFIPRENNVIAVLGRPDGKYIIPGKNIVTNAGDVHYAEDGAEETLTNTFGVLVLGTTSSPTPAKTDDFSNVTEISASEKAHDSGYPQTDDTDADNSGTTGTDVVTYLTSYTKGDFNATGITEGCITNATPGTSEPLLTRYAFSSSFDKTSDDTLKVFTNHEFNGV